MSPISTILQRVTDELRKVAARLDRTQGAVSALVLDAASPRSAHFHDLQDLDRATQEIAAIAAFLEKLSSDLPDEWIADPRGASLAVDLHELAAILGQYESTEPPVAAEHEYEIF